MIFAFKAVLCLGKPDCQLYTKDLNEGVITIMNLVGGLVSALVVAELALTEKTTLPTGKTVSGNAEVRSPVRTVITVIYLAVWIILGITALILGYIKYPNIVPALTEYSKSWFGIALAAIYAYLGLSPSNK